MRKRSTKSASFVGEKIQIMSSNPDLHQTSSSAPSVSGSGTFPHGVHPPERKQLAENAAIEVLPHPEKVVLPLLQHIGAPCTPVVKPKQEVVLGELVAKGDGFVTTSHHSPIAGVVQKMEVTTLSNGRHLQAVAIRAQGEQLTGKDLWDALYGGPWPLDACQSVKPEDITAAIRNAGIVGLGGAAFPTHVKFTPNDKKPIHTMVVNGCECEPYLTTDYRLMLEAPGAIIAGALLKARAVNAKQTVVGIEDNKPEAIAAMKQAAEGTGVKIVVLKTKYPQGSEKQLIKAALNLAVPLGGLPGDVGVAVSNVATAAATAMAVLRDRPLTHRVISVTGGGIVNPKNLLVPLGISMGEVLAYCGGLRPNAVRMVAGGPMMGFAFTDPATPVTKGTSGITILTQEELSDTKTTTCVRCGRCADVCPMHLVPTKIAAASRHKNTGLARRYNILACFECGSCVYVCPAGLPLVQNIRTGKALLAAEAKK
jgi:Na+-translocating ferredoxin:NAD+ oxidoreductase subunit C